MADIKEQLERLKRERQARSAFQNRKGSGKKSDTTKDPPSSSPSESVEEAWDKINRSSSQSTKEKLEQLINLTRTGAKPRPEPRLPEPSPRELIEREALRFSENPYPLNHRYGRTTLATGLDISGHVLACLSKDTAFESLDLSTALFIDLETTGLSGGTGVIPFNVGMGYYREDRFVVAQYFVGELAAEEQMIEELGNFFRDKEFQSVVTYNGKAFDIPLLETRFILYRKPYPLKSLPHLDFLFPARSLWKHKHESCRLFHLAHQVLATGRDEDIPSSEIPWRYFQYLQTGDFDLIEPVLYHNQEDILSLLGVVIEGALIFSEEHPDCSADAMDLFGAGKVMEKVGETEKSVEYFQRALNGSLSGEVLTQARKKLASHFKRNREWDKAVEIWREIASAEIVTPDELFAFRELAMYLEHKEKNYIEAQRISEEGYVLSMSTSVYYENDFSYRRERLKQKLKKKQAGEPPDESKPEVDSMEEKTGKE